MPANPARRDVTEQVPELCGSGAGKFLLIRDGQVEGIYDTYADAIKIGEERFQLGLFTVKRAENVLTREL